jgi:hypothetical protein
MCVCVCVCVWCRRSGCCRVEIRTYFFSVVVRCSEERGRGRERASERADRDPDFSRFLTQFLNARITQKVTTGQEQVLISYQRATRYSLALSHSLSPPHFRLSNDRAESLLSRQDFFFFLSFNIVFFFLFLYEEKKMTRNESREKHTHTKLSYCVSSGKEVLQRQSLVFKVSRRKTTTLDVLLFQLVHVCSLESSRVETRRFQFDTLTMPETDERRAWLGIVCKRSLCLSWFCFVPTSKE